MRTLGSAYVLLVMLGACGSAGDEHADLGSSPQASRRAATAQRQEARAEAAANFSGNRGSYVIGVSGSGYSVRDGSGNATLLGAVSALVFADMTVNLGIGAKAAAIGSADLDTLIDLYIAFFNRLPEADGLAQWLDQLAAGRSINQIADDFYAAAILYASVTGYASTMSNEDFVRIVYRNVLGRSGASAPPDADVGYWAGGLANGSQTRGSLVRAMVAAARSFKGDRSWGWVAETLENKESVARYFAVQQGLGYKSDSDNIIRTTALAAAVTASDTTAALQAMAAPDSQFSLVASATTGSYAPSGPQWVAPCPADVTAPLLSTVPVAQDDFLAFRPLGFLSPPIHMFPAKHGAFSMTVPGTTAQRKAVRAPAAVTVTEIYEATFSSTGNKNYQVFMHPCREVRLYFGHLATLSARLQAEFDRVAPVCNAFDDGSSLTTTCRRENLTLQLVEGEQFGTGPDTNGIDFGSIDFRRRPAAFTDLNNYDAYYPYYVPPSTLFAAAVRQALEAKTGNVFGTRMRTAQPLGGSYMEDLRGSAQGNWFIAGYSHANSTDLSNFLGLTHDYVDPAQPVLTVGRNVAGVSMGVFAYPPADSGLINRDWAHVRADGNVYCFDRFLTQVAGSLALGRPSGVFLMQLTDEHNLRLELRAGASCSVVNDWTLSSAATAYRR